MAKNPTVLITGASSGIGATYARRFASRGYDLILVARNKERLDAISLSLSENYNVEVDIIQADLTNDDDLAIVESRLKDDAKIEILINNAGIAVPGKFSEQPIDSINKLIKLNTIALVRLSHAVSSRFSLAGKGTIINIGSVAGLSPEYGSIIYGASKAFVLFLSQGLSQELKAKGVYVQAVLPATTRTEIWELAGIDIDKLPEVMEVDELVDAALVGFDRRELITIPSLHKGEFWSELDEKRKALISDVLHSHPAERYKD